MSCTLVELNCVSVLFNVINNAIEHFKFHVVETTLEVARRLTNDASASKEHQMTEDETCTRRNLLIVFIFLF